MSSDPSASRMPSTSAGCRGGLIAFEGIDGAGKTTQCRLTSQWLQGCGRSVLCLKEPTDGPIGSEIRQLAKSGRETCPPEKEFQLFLEDRRWNVETNILPGLRRGDVVLLDRYYISSIAYQGALGLDPERIQRENESFAPKPDRIILLDLPPERSHERIRISRGDQPNLFERAEYLEKVSTFFHSLTMPNLVRLDATLPIEVIQKRIQADLSLLLGL